MSRQPNILLINCDDLGYGDLGCYGSTRNDTPVLDALAQEGLRFTDFYMASAVCSPSRAALLTGCYPPRVGFGSFDGLPVLFPGQRFGLHPDEITIAALLRDAGYATQAVGKWHCGDQPDFLPTRHGFDGWYGLPYSNDMGRQRWPEEGPHWPSVIRESGIPFVDEYPPLPLMLDEEVLEAQPDQASLTARYVEESVRFVRANHDRPWFLYLAHIYVHLPIYVQERFALASRNGTYGAAVASIDWAAGVLLAELRRLGLERDTVVIFTSDNGSLAQQGGSNEPLRGRKGSSWDGGLRVPCIVRWPGRVPAGSISSALTTAMDLFPTLARTAGAPIPTDRVIDGRDITALLEDPSSDSPHEAFYYYGGERLEAVRSGRWKLHVARGTAVVRELYDLDSDVAETTDLATGHPDVVAELERHAERARVDLGDAVHGVRGSGCRAVGEVDEPVTLTTFDPEHPYYVAEYDLLDRG